MPFQVFVNVFGPLKHQDASIRLFPDLITYLTVSKMIDCTVQIPFLLAAMSSKL